MPNSDISTVYDSDDEQQKSVEQGFVGNSSLFIDKLTDNLSKDSTSYPATSFLTEIGNRVFLNEEIDKQYQKLKDPLTWKKNELEEKIVLIEAAQLAFDNNLIQDSNKQQIISKQLKNLQPLKDELKKLESLIKRRNQLFEGPGDGLTLKGAFPLIPRKLSEASLEDYRKNLPDVFKGKTDIKIQEYFIDLQKYLNDPSKRKAQEDYTNVLKHILPDEKNLIVRGDKYSAACANKVNNLLHLATKEEKGEYLRLNAHTIQERYKKDVNKMTEKETDSYIKNTKKYIRDNLEDIYDVITETKSYSLDHEYLGALEKLDNFVLEARLYRKIRRDEIKNTLVINNEGGQGVNIPPGNSTHMTIERGGSARTEVTRLGSYKVIAGREDNLPIIERYAEHSSDLQRNGDKEFRALMQLESMRSPAALIANEMFLELATSEYINDVSAKYNYENIPHLMPMAMLKAVRSAETTVQQDKGETSAFIKYDYDSSTTAPNAEILENRNQRLLFDYIISKAEILDEHGAVKEQTELKKEGWGVKKQGNELLIKKNNGEYQISLTSDSNYEIKEIKAFPSNIFHQLIKSHYDVDVSYLQDQTIEATITNEKEIGEEIGEETIAKTTNKRSAKAAGLADKDHPDQPPNKTFKPTHKDNNLTKAEKVNLSASSEIEEKIGLTYNLQAAIEAANAGQAASLATLEKLRVRAVIESDINLKAVDVLPPIAIQEKQNTTEQTRNKPPIRLVLESDHLSQHVTNVQKFAQQIDSGEISKQQVILLERKEYGDNLGMQDVIKLANIIEYNQKQAKIEDQIQLPANIEHSLIYADAKLYQAARENEIKVIGLEGKNLKTEYGSAAHDRAREEYMVDIIEKLGAKNYEVIANIGQNHAANIQERLPQAKLEQPALLTSKNSLSSSKISGKNISSNTQTSLISEVQQIRNKLVKNNLLGNSRNSQSTAFNPPRQVTKQTKENNRGRS